MRLTRFLVSAPALAAPLTLLVAGCVAPPSAPAPRPVPAPRPAPVPPAEPAPPAAVEWQYRPATPGNWTYRADPAGPVALFGESASTPRLTLRCDRATRRISLGRAGGGQGAITVRTSYGASSWPAVMAGTQVPQLTAVRGASDAVLDQLAYSRGRFAVEVHGQETLIVPAWAEISRVIEECRG
jgi:hypothetical protein